MLQKSSRTCAFCKVHYPNDIHIGHNVSYSEWYCSAMCWVEANDWALDGHWERPGQVRQCACDVCVNELKGR